MRTDGVADPKPCDSFPSVASTPNYAIGLSEGAASRKIRESAGPWTEGMDGSEAADPTKSPECKLSEVKPESASGAWRPKWLPRPSLPVRHAN